MVFGITPTGFVIKDFDILRQELIDQAKSTIASNLDERVTNPLIQLITVMAAQFQRLENLQLDLYGNISVATATGTALDTHAAERGLTRQVATQASGILNVVGSPASVITNGATFSTSGEDATVFAAQNRVEIGLLTETFSGAAVDNFQVVNEALGNFGTNQVLVTVNTTDYTETDDSPPLAIEEFHCDYANPSTITFKDAVLTTDIITITYYNAAETNEDVPIQAVDAGIVGNVGPNTIDTVISPLAGITSVNNVAGIIGGVDEESDAGLRIRLIAVSLANWTEDQLKSLLEDIEGIRTVLIDDGIEIETIDDTNEAPVSTYFTNTIAISAQRLFRVKFFDDSLGTFADWIETGADPAAGEYRFTGPGTTIEYGTSLDTDDTLTITYMDNNVGTGVFNVIVVADSPPLSVVLRDTIESTLATQKPFGVSPFVIEPSFVNIRITITTVLETGFTAPDVASEIQAEVTTYLAAFIISQDIIHNRIIDITMEVEGVIDISGIGYQIIDESITKGATDGIDVTLVAPASLIGTTITDADGNTFTKDTHYQYHATGIDWSIGDRQQDAVKIFDSTGGTYDDKTTEANSGAGSTFNMFDVDPELGDYVLIGQDERFNKIKYDMAGTQADGDWQITPYFWSGSWTPCTNVLDSTIDVGIGAGTSSYTQDGSITFDHPQSAWVTTTIDSVNAYWIKLEITGPGSPIFNTDPTCESTRTAREPPQNKKYTASYNLVGDTNVAVPDSAVVVEESTVVN